MSKHNPKRWRRLLEDLATNHGHESREYGMTDRAIKVAFTIGGLPSYDLYDDLIGYLVTEARVIALNPKTPDNDEVFYAYLWRALERAAVKFKMKHRRRAETEWAPQGYHEESSEEALELAAARDEEQEIEDWDNRAWKSSRVHCAQFAMAKNYVTFLPHTSEDPVISRLRWWETADKTEDGPPERRMGYSGLSAEEWHEVLTRQLKAEPDSFRKPVALGVHALRQMDLTYKEIAEVCGLSRSEAHEKQAERAVKGTTDAAWMEEITKHVI